VEAVSPRIEIDGHPATAAELGHFALGNYGHFTAMQVREGRTRGLDLHLARLDAAQRELFGDGLDPALVRSRIRHALGETRDASVRVTGFWPEGAAEPSLLVSVRPPADTPRSPQSLRTAPYQRPVAHVKHLGGFGQSYYGRVARRTGFDDALLVGPGGVVSEGAITNLGCYDGTSVVWPDAPALNGVTMLLLERDLPGEGVPSRRGPVRVDDLPSYASVFVTNSHGVAAVDRVDDLRLPVDEEFVKTVRRTYESVPWDVI
jgi:branched-subunit amino acid aminotransferase/4-amino-4-deoxychorismate lyase